MEELALRVKRANKILDWIIDGAQTEQPDTYDIEKDILHGDTPNNWNVWQEGNMETMLEVDFNKFAIAVTQRTGQKLKGLSTFGFYAGVELVEDMNPTTN